MEALDQAKKIISQSKNILIIGPENPSFDKVGSAYSLYYTLSKSGKIANHCLDELPENFAQVFDFPIQPKKFVINIKDKDISQLYYEKEKNDLKIFLTTKERFINKEDLEIKIVKKKELEKCDLIITIGLKNLEELGELYDQNFKMFYETPILNIDNNLSNGSYGNFNLIEDQPLAIIIEKLIDSKSDEKNKTWLLLSIADYLKTKKPTKNALDFVFATIKENFDFSKLIKILYGKNDLLIHIFKKIKVFKDTIIISLTNEDFKKTNSTPKDLSFILEKLTKEMFCFPKLLVLWQGKENINGVLYSNNEKILEKINGQRKNNAIIFETKTKDLKRAEEKIKKII